jgi:hypothetical protein
LRKVAVKRYVPRKMTRPIDVAKAHLAFDERHMKTVSSVGETGESIIW